MKTSKRWVVGLLGYLGFAAVHSGAATEFYTWAGTGPGRADGTNSGARFFQPCGVARDSAGNFYISDSYNHTIRKMTPTGIVTTFAGAAGQTGTNDGVGAAARFTRPLGLTVDGSNNVFVADADNSTIRKITPAGAVTTFAGLATQTGSLNGLGSAARFNVPCGVGVDGSNNVFVADTANHIIRKITPAGLVTTVAGNPGVTGTNNGSGTQARFNLPRSVAVDSDGALYVADMGNQLIRKITLAGTVSTFAGQAGIYGRLDGTGTAAQFANPAGVALDAAHALFVADYGSSHIRQITPAAAVTTLAGSALGYLDATGIVARFTSPMGLTVDATGNLIVADTMNNLMRKITQAGVVTTLAGVGPGHEDGAVGVARFYSPGGVALDAQGNLYVADTYNDTLRKITPAGLVSTLAGTAGSWGTNNGTGAVAQFSNPAGLAVDTAGQVFVADEFNHAIRRVTPEGVVTTLAGQPGTQGTNDGTTATAHFRFPQGVAVDGNGVVYVADTQNHTIRRIAAGVVGTWAGAAGTTGTNDGPGLTARFQHPAGLVVDALGFVYVADRGNATIRKITPAGLVSTLAGTPGVFGLSDGTGSAAHFLGPNGLALDGAGNLYVTEINHCIRKVTPAGVVTTLAGESYVAGYLDGLGAAVRLNDPRGIAVDPTGILYVADQENNTIRRGATQTPQLFFQDNGGQLASWVLETNGVFRFARPMTNTGDWKLKAAGDVDGDGISDLLFQTAAGDTGGWFMHTDSTARDPRFWWNIGAWVLKAAGDYEATGRAQLFFQTPDGAVAYWRLDATGTFQSAVQLGNQGAWKLKAAADLDRDGKAELFWQTAAGAVAIWFHDGPGGAIRGYLAGNTGEWALCGAVDVDGDAIGDLIWQTPDSRTGGWFMNTNGTARAANFWWATGGWTLKAAGR
jgi:hypothetical protein